MGARSLRIYQMLAIFVLAVVIVAVSAVAIAAEVPLRIILPNAPNDLDPHTDPTAVGDSIFSNLYETLLVFDGAGQAKPVLATSWEAVSNHGWLFKIRGDVRFHDGREMTSEDVAASIERARTHPRSDSRVALSNVKQAVAVDSKTIRIELNGPDAIFLKKLNGVFVVPHDAPEYIRDPIGTGAFTVTGHQPGESLSLEAFADYWGSSPHVDKVTLVFEEDREVALQQLLSGSADLVPGVLPSSVSAVEKNDDLWVDSSLGSQVFFVGLNTTKPPFDNPLLREAVDVAMDRQQVADEVFLKYARPASQLVNHSAYGHAPEVGPVERDLVRARALVSAVGGGEPVRIVLEHASGNEDFARVVALQLEEAGFQIEVKSRGWSELLGRFLKGEIEAAIFTWRSELHDVGYTFDKLIHSESSSGPKIGVSDPAIDQLIVASRTALDIDLRLSLLHSVTERVAFRRVLVPIVWVMDLYGVRRNIEWHPEASRNIDLSSISRKVE